MNKVDTVINAYLDGALGEAGCADLAAWIRADPKNADHFARCVLIHRQSYEILNEYDMSRMAADAAFDVDDCTASFADLAALAAGEDDSTIVDITDKLRQREQAELEARRKRQFTPAARGDDDVVKNYVIPRPVFYGGIAAAMTLLAMVVWPLISTQTATTVNHPTAPGATQPAVIASLESSVDAVWGDGRHRADHAQLLEGRYELTEGLARIVYASGAKVTLEAPARFTLDSQEQITLDRGKLVGHCPPRAHGFVVETPAAHIVDLGTEFGVNALDGSRSEVHVFEGRVKSALRGADGSIGVYVPLMADEALQLDSVDQSTVKMPALTSAFVRTRDSSAFDYRFEGDHIPAPQVFDSDAGWSTDGEVLYIDNVASNAVGRVTVFGVQGQLSAKRGWTCEYRFRVLEAQSGTIGRDNLGVLGLVIGTNKEDALYGLLVSDRQIFRTHTPDKPENSRYAPIYDGNFTDGFHTVRLAKPAGDGQPMLWVDGRRIHTPLPHFAYGPTLNRAFLGDHNDTVGNGRVALDYFRVDTSGAFVPDFNTGEGGLPMK